MANTNQMSEWEKICEAFAKKMDADLVFVNETSCGIQYKNGVCDHIYFDEMQRILEQLDKAEKEAGEER
jgi:hypothetical protein